MPRVQRRFLLRSRWTAVSALDDACHFEVVEVSGDVVKLRAVLTGRDHEVAIADLDDPAVWSLGWQSRA